MEVMRHNVAPIIFVMAFEHWIKSLMSELIEKCVIE